MPLPLALSVLHLLSCMTLAFASIHWKFKRPAENEAHRLLFPYLLITGILGAACIMGPVVGIIMVSVQHGMRDAYSYYLNGPDAWLLYLSILLPLLPALGMVPAIGRKHLMVAGLALLSMLPASFSILSKVIHSS